MPLFSDDYIRQYDPDGFFGEYGLSQIFALQKRDDIDRNIILTNMIRQDEMPCLNRPVYISDHGYFTLKLERSIDSNVIGYVAVRIEKNDGYTAISLIEKYVNA